MGFKDFFLTGSSNKDRSYRPRGIPTASDYHYAEQSNLSSSTLGANGKPLSATDKLYMNYGSQSNAGSRSMSLNSRSMYNPSYTGQRTMSMTNYNGSNGSSKYGGSRIRPNTGSRSNSITSRTSQNLANSHGRRVNGSRANSLTSNGSRTPRVIKTTTTTTKEQDTTGRTRSITRTTIEQRGDVKIVRTTKTIITPSDGFDESDPNLVYEGFDQDITQPEYADDLYDRPMTPVEEYDDDDEVFEEHILLSPQEEAYAAARGAAAAALGLPNRQQQQQQQQRKRFQQEQYEQQQPLQRPQFVPKRNEHVSNNNNIPKKQQVNQQFQSIPKKQTDVLSGSPKRAQEVRFNESHMDDNTQQISMEESSHAHFKEKPETDEYVYESYELSNEMERSLSHDYHAADTHYPTGEIEKEQNLDNVEPVDDAVIGEDGDIYEPIYDEPEPANFEELRRNRLSEIAEVTEPFDDTLDIRESRGPTDSIVIRKPVNDSLELDDTIDMSQHIDYSEETPGPETEDEYVEASDAFITPNRITEPQDEEAYESFDDTRNKIDLTPAKVSSVGLGVAPIDSTLNVSKTQHLYRNLLFTENGNSPSKNSIPKFSKENNDSQISTLNTHQNIKKNIVTEGSSIRSDSKPLKPALKNSTASINESTHSSIQESSVKIPAKMSVIPDSDYIQAIPSRTSIISSSPRLPQKAKSELSPAEMYALAYKAAEKKVYGETRANIPVQPVEQDSDFDAETIRNTQINTQSSLIEQNDMRSINSNQISKSSSGLPYKSNAPAKFKLKSMKDNISTQSDRESKSYEAHVETKRLKKELEKEGKKERKQWEAERKEMLANLRIDQNNNFVSVPPTTTTTATVEMAPNGDEPVPQTPTKKTLFGFGKKKSSPSTHKHSGSIVSEASEVSASNVTMTPVSQRRQSGLFSGLVKGKSKTPVPKRSNTFLSSRASGESIRPSSSFVPAVLPVTQEENAVKMGTQPRVSEQESQITQEGSKEVSEKGPQKKKSGNKGNKLGFKFKKFFDLQ